MSDRPFSIAIDGPAASGKGTLARQIALRLNLAFLDTGAIYRAVTWQIMRQRADTLDDMLAVAAKLRDNFNLELLQNPDLRRDEVGANTSKISAIPEIRAMLLDLQRNFAAQPPAGFKGAVLDGRDIGTVVLPQAAVKLFVTAETEIRALRRYKELQSKGFPSSYEAVLEDMQARDARDSGRDVAPLRPAEDAVIVDTSHLSAEAALDKALQIIALKTA